MKKSPKSCSFLLNETHYRKSNPFSIACSGQNRQAKIDKILILCWSFKSVSVCVVVIDVITCKTLYAEIYCVSLLKVLAFPNPSFHFRWLKMEVACNIWNGSFAYRNTEEKKAICRKIEEKNYLKNFHSNWMSFTQNYRQHLNSEKKSVCGVKGTKANTLSRCTELWCGSMLWDIWENSNSMSELLRSVWNEVILLAHYMHIHY